MEIFVNVENVDKYFMGLEQIIRLVPRLNICLITDLMQFSDLWVGFKEEKDWNKELNEYVNRTVAADEYVWKVAREIEENCL